MTEQPEPTGDDKQPYFMISSLAKGLKVLEHLAQEGEASVSQVAARLGLHRSAAHRFLATLKELGWVTQSARSTYRLSYRLFELGMRQSNMAEVKQAARSFMLRLSARHGETINLGRLEGSEVILIDRVESRQFLRIDLALGARVPAVTTALGKAMLAFADPADVNRMLDHSPPPRLTEKSLDRVQLFDQLAKIRELGYALDDEELRIGIRCVACPVMDFQESPFQAISVSGPTSRMTKSRMIDIGRDLVVQCRELSLAMGWRNR